MFLLLETILVYDVRAKDDSDVEVVVISISRQIRDAAWSSSISKFCFATL
jgi:hypothetical protein